MPSIRKQKIQKRSRQQRRRVVTTVADMEQTDADRQRLEEQRQEAFDREEGTWINRNSDRSGMDDEEGFGAFDNGGGSLKKRMNKRINKRSRQQRRRRPFNTNDLESMTQTDADRQVLEQERLEVQRLDEEDRLEQARKEQEQKEEYERMEGTWSGPSRLTDRHNEMLNDSWDTNGFDNGGGSLKKRISSRNAQNRRKVTAINGGGRKSTQARAVSLKTAVKLLRNYYAKRN